MRAANLTNNIMTEAEVAAVLKKSVRTLRMWRRAKYGPRHFNIGITVHYLARDVDEWLGNHGARHAGRPRRVQA